MSVLVGGALHVGGAATGAEGTVVAFGDALFALDAPGSYAVGVTALGSQVTPYAGSDMLVVGGNLGAVPGTHLDVGQGLGGDVVVGGGVADGTDLDPHGQTVDQAVVDATAPYADLVGQLAPMSASYAGLPSTGEVDVTDDGITFTGDGVSDPQSFMVDGSSLGAQAGSGRSLRFRGVPQDATIVVNLTGTDVDIDVDELLTPDGLPVDPQADPYFADLATHLLWNAPVATTVDVGGQAQLPGSLLVPTAPSTTTLAGRGTNGRIMVAGDLVHTGPGELHAYPFLSSPQLGCAADPVHLTTLSLSVDLIDPDKVVDRDRFYEGEFACSLGGVDVTPSDHKWRMRAGTPPRVLSDEIPSGAVCDVAQQLTSGPAPFRSWAPTLIQPEVLVVEKRRDLAFTITNRVKDAPPPPETPTATPTPTPTATPTPTESVPEPPVTSSPTPEAPESSPASTSVAEPTNRPELPSSPSAQPTTEPSATATPSADSGSSNAEPSSRGGPAGPLTTTAPFTLRGAFVWGPMLMLSLLTLLLRVRRRPRQVRAH